MSVNRIRTFPISDCHLVFGFGSLVFEIHVSIEFPLTVWNET
jgi:hypothetical protein